MIPACNFIAGIILAGLTLTTASMGMAEPGPDPNTMRNDTLVDSVLTLSEAAQLLRVQPEIILDMAVSGQVPGRQMGPEWRFSHAALLSWLGQSWPTQVMQGQPLTVAEASTATARGTSASHSAADPTDISETVNGRNDQERPPASATIGTAPESATADQMFLRDQRVLLAPNRMSFDLGMFYTRSDTQVYTEAGLAPSLANIEADTVTTSLVARYSLPSATELFASVAYQRQEVAAFVAGEKLEQNASSRLSGVRLGFRHTLVQEGRGRPDVILTLDGSVPTGDTSYSLGSGITLVKSFDPAVLFGSFNYRHTFSKDFNNLTLLEPEHQLDVVLGYAFALNDTLTLSAALSGAFSAATSFDQAKLRQQELFRLELGLTSWLAKGLYIEPSVSFNLNGPDNAVVFGLTVPFSLSSGSP